MAEPKTNQKSNPFFSIKKKQTTVDMNSSTQTNASTNTISIITPTVEKSITTTPKNETVNKKNMSEKLNIDKKISAEASTVVKNSLNTDIVNTVIEVTNTENKVTKKRAGKKKVENVQSEKELQHLYTVDEIVSKFLDVTKITSYVLSLKESSNKNKSQKAIIKRTKTHNNSFLRESIEIVQRFIKESIATNHEE